MQFDPFALASSDSIAIAATLLAGLAVLYNALLFTVKFGTSTAHRLILVVLVVTGAQFLVDWVKSCCRNTHQYFTLPWLRIGKVLRLQLGWSTILMQHNCLHRGTSEE